MAGAKHQDYLIEFRCGGKEFAAQARTLRGIAGAGWRPRQDPDRRWLLAEMLGLPGGQGQRTLLVADRSGASGFVVDSISKRPIQPESILPVPDLLRDWLPVPALTGLALRDGERRVLQILDLAVLADWARSREPVPEPERG